MNAKLKKYDRLFEQIQKLIEDKPNVISRMATISAVLHHKMQGFFWTGFYLLDEGELMVGPYQGPLACLKLRKDTGVCWASVNAAQSMVVPDVHQFPGHIACSSLTNSEIVVPVFDGEARLVAVLDVDSREFEHFNHDDRVAWRKLYR
jgi:GAF domain-containing protein